MEVKRRDVYPVFIGIGHLFRQPRIEAVDTLHDEHRTIAELQRGLVPLPFARNEIIAGNIHALPVEELSEVLVGSVFRSSASMVSVIEIAVLVAGRLLLSRK